MVGCRDMVVANCKDWVVVGCRDWAEEYFDWGNIVDFLLTVAQYVSFRSISS